MSNNLLLLVADTGDCVIMIIGHNFTALKLEKQDYEFSALCESE